MRQVLSQANWHPQPQGNPETGTLFALLACRLTYSPSMFAFVLRRLFQAVIVMITVAFIAFLLFQYVGDPVVFLSGTGRHA
jgi:hypothetical protein